MLAVHDRSELAHFRLITFISSFPFSFPLRLRRRQSSRLSSTVVSLLVQIRAHQLVRLFMLGVTTTSRSLQHCPVEAIDGLFISHFLALCWGGILLISRSSGIYVANRVSDKLTSIHDRIYCCRSGSAADTQAISDMVRRYVGEHAIDKGGLPSVKSAAHLFRTLCYKNKDRLMAGIICAGWDPVRGGQVYSVPIGGTCIRQPFSIGGSGSTYIYGYVDSAFKEGMTRDECIEFVRNCTWDMCTSLSFDG